MTTRRTGGPVALGAWVAVWLGACGTPYQPLGFMGGFHEVPFGEDAVLVTFHWTRFTPRDRIADFLLLRAAEVALGRDAPYFVVLEQPSQLQTDFLHGTLAARPTSQPSVERGAARGPGEEMLIRDRRTVEIRIQLLKERPPSGSLAWDAAKLRAELREKYGLEK